jgi:hypothetical protein
MKSTKFDSIQTRSAGPDAAIAAVPAPTVTAAETNGAEPTDSAPPLSDDPGVFTRANRFIERVIERVRSDSPKLTGLDATAAAVVESQGGRYVFAEIPEVGGLKELQATHKRTRKYIEAHLPEAAKIAFTKHHNKTLQESIHDGSAQEGWTFKDFDEDYAQKRDAAKNELHRIYLEAFAIAQPICKRYCAIATKFAQELEDGERERHENFGVPYKQASALVLEIRKTVKYVAARSVKQEFCSSSPRELVPFLDL